MSDKTKDNVSNSRITSGGGSERKSRKHKDSLLKKIVRKLALPNSNAKNYSNDTMSSS